MNYQQWRSARDGFVAEIDGLLRLDCMNPFHAMDHMPARGTSAKLGDVFEPDNNGEMQDLHSRLLRQWATNMRIQVVASQCVLTCGIRSWLKYFFANYQSRYKKCIWLPRDVFPTYSVLASTAGWSVREFETFEGPRWDRQQFKDGPPVALLPVPLSPLGRGLGKSEASFWLNWLDKSPDRILILDTVYAYQPGNLQGLARLRMHHRCITAWSVSKTWLYRCVFGFAEVHESIRERFDAGNSRKGLAVSIEEDATAMQGRLLNALERDPDLPRIQYARYVTQWDKLKSQIAQICPGWNPPETGYFSLLPIQHQSLLNDHQVLAVPASVFGSNRNEFSVITCLYDIKTDDALADAKD